MKRFCYLISFFLCLISYALSNAHAIYDPLSVANNRVGVHILSPDELELAAKLVNNNHKGAWGYVTVPIQTTDRNRARWTKFMEKAAELKVIPIIRVATTGDGPYWIKPEDNDLIDFANFLNDLPWPTQNRYVIIFNEVNRSDEYGGQVSPEDYADILNNAIDTFKARSDKFFILPSALDNAAPQSKVFMRYDTYLTRMNKHSPGIFDKIDGWNSHAYGNPAFSQSPVLSGSNKANSFRYDLDLINRFTAKKLPIFITEAGWSNQNLDNRLVATYFNYAFSYIWNDQQIVAVTPFLLFAGTPPFSQFSLLDPVQRPTLAYEAIASFVTIGQPLEEDYTLIVPTPTPEIPTRTPPKPTVDQLPFWQKFINRLTAFFSAKPDFKTVVVGDKTYQVEVVRSFKDISVGLAKYKTLKDGQGMLFDLQTASQLPFWMKGMKFDIDIVWIKDNQVIGVSQGFANNPYKLISPPSSVNYVLEVNPDSMIQVGDQVKINNEQ